MRGSVWLRPCLSSPLELLNLPQLPFLLLLLHPLQRQCQRQRVLPHPRLSLNRNLSLSFSTPRSRCLPQSRLRWLNR